MKILTLSLFLFPLALFAQFSKGDKYITANFDFYADNPSGNNNAFYYSSKHYFGITPGAGYFVSNNLAIGVQAGYSHSLQRSAQDNGRPDLLYHTHGYSITPFVRKYWAISDKFLFSVTARAGYSRSFSKLVSETPGLPTKSYGVSASMSPSLIFFPTTHWSIETSIASLSYSFSKRLAHDTHYDSIFLSYGSINFGVAYYFRK